MKHHESNPMAMPQKMSRNEAEHMIWLTTFLAKIPITSADEAEDLATAAVRKYSIRWELSDTPGHFEAESHRDAFSHEISS